MLLALVGEKEHIHGILDELIALSKHIISLQKISMASLQGKSTFRNY
jgi:hypothetical protein